MTDSDTLPTTPSLEDCLAVLGALSDLAPDAPERRAIERALASFNRSGRHRRRAEQRELRTRERTEVTERTALGAVDRVEDVALDDTGLPSCVGVVEMGLRCYICKQPYRRVDGFYHRLCPPCAAENRERRHARTDLSGRLALVTGGRVKVGHELVLKLLRDGAEVIVTSRFPHDTRRRFAAAPDHDLWAHRLRVHPIDLRDLGGLVAWCDRLVAEGRPLDILVNNAAQTIRRPASAYGPLLAAERAALGAGAFVPRFELGAAPGVPVPGYEPGSDPVPVDPAGLIPDRASANSWSQRVDEVDPVELLEVQLVNVTAPFVLVGRLLPLLRSAPAERRYIVNVSAVEGQFGRAYKSAGHPHTNMAKAALNMLTRTSAEELAARGVYMTSVDTGWITDEKPAPDKERVAAAGFRTPLDIVDGAARVYDPIVRGERGQAPYGCFLKDYRVAPW
ncbi:short-chain dehydrogenase [Embleya scabrispora]|uniref:Short-chain dehydrogenase n=1 Tax=Embleya scabrispora TaxID=159449 RepID=A0A1T3P8Z1_9ACTN|nr:SDR family NAD(P)-dependent oxidoreductase [Embleya scabrispora]OPC85385.1 short-chain dehydrogenase [Embleya scabrispora]